MSGKTICIIGGGVIGLCTAYYALRKGHTVTVVERDSPERNGCSFGNAGMIVPSHFTPLAAPGMVSLGLRMLLHPGSPFAIRPRLDPELIGWAWKFARAANRDHVARSAPLLRDLNLTSRACYEQLAEALPGKEQGNFGLTKRGLLMLCKTEKTLHEEAEVASQARALGLDAEVLTPQQAAERDPGLQMDIAGAVYFAQDCHLTPQRFMASLTRALEPSGVTFLYNTEVTGWQTADRDGRRQITGVRTTQGDRTADEFVLASGSWSASLVRELGLRLPMQAGKGYSVTHPAPRQLPNLCSILTEARVAVTPMGSSLRFAGTMEIAGLDLSIDRARVQGIFDSIPRYFPEFRPDDFQNLPVWSGLRPCSPDGLPYIGRFARFYNLSVATGHAMMGLSLGPVTGKLLAELLSDEPPSLPLDALSPDRYNR